MFASTPVDASNTNDSVTFAQADGAQTRQN